MLQVEIRLHNANKEGAPSILDHVCIANVSGGHDYADYVVFRRGQSEQSKCTIRNWDKTRPVTELAAEALKRITDDIKGNW